ncbi:hypothetical protein SANTM175S_10795 [Streptomyces antimycoticus]
MPIPVRTTPATPEASARRKADHPVHTSSSASATSVPAVTTSSSDPAHEGAPATASVTSRYTDAEAPRVTSTRSASPSPPGDSHITAPAPAAHSATETSNRRPKPYRVLDSMASDRRNGEGPPPLANGEEEHLTFVGVDTPAGSRRRHVGCAPDAARRGSEASAGARHEGRSLPRAAATAPRRAGERTRCGTVEVLLCEVGEQAGPLRDGRADVALMHRPFDDLAGFDTADLHTEGQIALLPAGHPLASRDRLTLAEVRDVPDLPIARWPRLDGSYPDGPGPEVHTQSQLAQLVALGRTLLVIPASSRARQWPDHVAVPVVDAPDVTTVIAWPPGSRSPAVASLVRSAAGLHGTTLPASAR